jgi:hypothetical protein
MGGAGGGGGDTTPPTVAIVSPDDGSTQAANATFTVVATATDNVGVSRAELVWSYNNVVMRCDNAPEGVTCSQSGNSFTWSFRVGTGSRTFHVTAYDAAGNHASTADRTVRLGSGPPPPPPGGPSVSITDPSDGSTVNPGDNVTVTATVMGTDISTVDLDWAAPSGRAMFPMSQSGNGTYSVTVQVSPYAQSGPRQLTVTARDTNGNAGSAQLQLSVP